MEIRKTFKTQVYVHDFTNQYCNRCFGVRRATYNWILSRFLEEKKKTGKMPDIYDLDGEYRRFRKSKNDSNFEWIADQLVSPKIMAETLKNVKSAFAVCKTFKKKSKKKNIVPFYKKKKDRLKTFSIAIGKNSDGRIENNYLFSFPTTDPKHRAELHTKESLNFLLNENIKLCRFTVSKKAGKLYLAIQYKILNYNEKQKSPENTKIGIDLGIVISAVTYDNNGTFKKYSFNTKKSLRLDRLSKKNDSALSKKQKYSHNYEKLLLLKEKRSRRAALHRKELVEMFSTWLVKNYSEIIIDDFNFKQTIGRCKTGNEKAYKSMVFTLKKRIIEKAKYYGTTVRFVEHLKGIKTTHKCSQCGSTDVLIDKQTRILKCKHCGLIIDRDYNAAINTFNL